MSIEYTIEHFILDEYSSGNRQAKIDPDESLISSGILDSMALLRLVVFIEKEFSVTVGDGELIPYNFETINRIKSFIEAKHQV